MDHCSLTKAIVQMCLLCFRYQKKDRQFRDHLMYLRSIYNMLTALHNVKVRDIKSKVSILSWPLNFDLYLKDSIPVTCLCMLECKKAKVSAIMQCYLIIFDWYSLTLVKYFVYQPEIWYKFNLMYRARGECKKVLSAYLFYNPKNSYISDLSNLNKYILELVS